MKSILIITVTIVLLCAVMYLARERVLLAVGDFLVVQDELRPADLIHVISGPDHRTDYGIQLYHQGLGREIFFTGGFCSEIQGNHAERSYERAVAQGVPAVVIATDGFQVTSTYSEVVRLEEFMDKSQIPIRSVIVVSEPYHMRRARWTYRQVLGDGVGVQMAPVPFELSPYRRQWWDDEESREFVKDEYLKMVYYFARYRVNWRPLSKWLASFDTY